MRQAAGEARKTATQVFYAASQSVIIALKFGTAIFNDCKSVTSDVLPICIRKISTAFNCVYQHSSLATAGQSAINFILLPIYPDFDARMIFLVYQ